MGFAPAHVAAQAAVGAAGVAMVKRLGLVEGTGLEAVHAGGHLVDPVPAEPLPDAADRGETITAVELQGAAHVFEGARSRLPLAVVLLEHDATGDAKPRVAVELGEQPDEVVRAQLDVAVELAEVGEQRKLAGIDRVQAVVEGARRRCDLEAIIRRSGEARRSRDDVHEVEFARQAVDDLRRFVVGAVVDHQPVLRRRSCAARPLATPRCERPRCVRA